MKVTYTGERCYHPGAAIDLVPGELEISDDQVEQLRGVPGIAGLPPKLEPAAADEAVPTKRSSKRGDAPQEKE
jgi:hypothetical protein